MNQKKNKKMLIILIILVIIFIIGIGITYICLATDLFKSEKRLFFKYITQVGDKEEGFISSEVTKYFEKQKNTPYKNNGSITFNITSSGNQEQFENTNKCSIDFSGKVDKTNLKSEQEIDINYSNDVKFPLFFKQIGNELGLQTQYIGSKFLAIKTDEMDELTGGMIDTQGIIPSNNEEIIKVPDDKLKYIKDTYFNLLNQELKDNNFVKVVEDKITGYKLTLNGEEVKNIIIKSFEILKNDQILLDTINEYLASKGLDKIKIEDIEKYIEEFNENSEISNEKLEIIVYTNSRKLSKIIIALNEIKLTIEKEENANNKQYTVSSELYQDNKTTRIYLVSSFSGLQSLQNITEDWELGIQTSDNTQYIYYYNNDVEFIESANIEEFNDDNALLLTDMSQEQLNTFLNAVGQRIAQVNSQQMERLGLTEDKNPLINAIPLLNMYATSIDSIDGMMYDLDETLVEAHNTKFENYESLDAQGTTVKGLISTIQANNQTNEDEKYLQITEINFNGEEFEPTDENIMIIKSEISLEDTYKIEFEKKSNTGMIYRVVINKN